MNEKEKTARKLENMKKYVDFLKSKRNITKKQLSTDYGLESAIERNFQTALECVIEIGEIIISKEGFRRPEKYRDIILILGENGILPERFAKKFEKAIGFRNVLVHHYAEVDLNKLYEYLQKNLKDFDTFARHVVRYLRKPGQGSGSI